MARKKSESIPAKTGRTWSPVKGLTITERGPLQFQARVRRIGRASQTPSAGYPSGVTRLAGIRVPARCFAAKSAL